MVKTDSDTTVQHALLFLRNIFLSKIRHVNKFNNLHSCLLPYLNTLFSLFGFKPLKHKVCLNNF